MVATDGTTGVMADMDGTDGIDGTTGVMAEAGAGTTGVTVDLDMLMLGVHLLDTVTIIADMVIEVTDMHTTQVDVVTTTIETQYQEQILLLQQEEVDQT